MNSSIQESLTRLNQALNQVSETATMDAQVLVAHIIEKPRSWVLAHPETQLSEAQQNQLEQALARLVHGEPLPYVIGHWEFFGLDFDLTPDVLIPRPETELLVERGLAWSRGHPNRRKVVDIGTGSGCIAIALAMNIPYLQVLATDISQNALTLAKKNAEKYGLMDRLEFIQADLLEGILGTFDMMCANLPYIPSQALRKLAVYGREPDFALDGGASGMEKIDRLLGQATSRLAAGGIMLLEIESSRGAEGKALAQASFPGSQVQVLQDLAGRDRCIEIERSSLIGHLCRRKDWLAAQEHGEYRATSLDQVGFIHCSQAEQILQVANRFYREIPDLVLLWIDPEKVNPEIRWETADGEQFPHIYGMLNMTAVVGVTDLTADTDGTYRLVHTPG